MFFFSIKKSIILFGLVGIIFVLLFAKNIPMAFAQADACGDGIINGKEVCDKNGDVGCAAPTPACKTDCSGCIGCTLKSNLVFMGKPIVCIAIDTIKWLLSIIGKLALLTLILGGVYYVTSGDNPEKQEKAKKIISYAIIGLIIVLVSYGLLALIDRIFAQS